MSEPLPEFDLSPDPRILPMLGEINLPQWQCVAELLDNSIDGFLEASRQGAGPSQPEVHVHLPTADSPEARVTVRDNGPGMSAEVLEKAVRAGWTGNSPIGSLGLFGMGFNIATARLGSLTTVWTATPEAAEWHGLHIDFDQLRGQRHFKTPHLTRPKADPLEHGTEVTIERLKPEQRQWLAKPSNQAQLRDRLSVTYSAMLRADGVPISFQLRVNGRILPAQSHCVWDEQRFAQLPRLGEVHAWMPIDRRLPDRPYCLECWEWLSAEDEVCPVCGSADRVIQRQRHVHGWIGLQRYLSTWDFGIDFIRNGRKIEVRNKDLFEWHTQEGTVEQEYPIDDPRGRGRIVGEIHLDHCRVPYTKDRFDRTDPAWDDMVRVVRGDGPLRPEKAAELGFGANGSPLFRLFQAFRRSSPPNARVAGGWARVLVVKDNERAEEMARLFQKGIADYQADTRWWELVVEEDNRLLTPGLPPTPAGGPASGAAGGLPGFSSGASDTSTPSPEPFQPQPAPVRTAIASLTREYRHDRTNLRWDVHAFEVDEKDPALGSVDNPWRMVRRTSGEEDFYVNRMHPVFRSATLTVLDALLCQLAWSAADFTRAQPGAPSFATIIGDLRDRYAGEFKLDPAVLKSQADLLLISIAGAWSVGLDEEDTRALFERDLSPAEQELVYGKMAVRSVGNPQAVISQGRFLEFAPPRVLADFVIRHPEHFFDGRCWDDPYSQLQFPSQSATDEARLRVVRRYEALLLDAVWLAEQEAGDLSGASRERLLRAALALDMLAPTNGGAA